MSVEPPIVTVLDAERGLGRSIPDDLAAQLRARIHGGLLGPGDRLPNERDLAAAFGIGRLTLREAIRSLVADGYLVSKRGNSGGTYVSDLERPHREWIERIRRDPAWVIDLLEYRKAVEMRAAELAASRRRSTHLTEMRSAIDEGTHPPTRLTFRQADHRFHVAVAQASGSARLQDAIVRARGELFLPTDKLAFHDHFHQTHDEHTAIYDAIESGDPDAARASAEHHLQNSLHDFLTGVIGEHGDRGSLDRPPALQPPAGGHEHPTPARDQSRTV